MVKVALLVRLEAKPGKESAVAQFLESALPLANQESCFGDPRASCNCRWSLSAAARAA